MIIRNATKDDVDMIWEIEKESRELLKAISAQKFRKLINSKTDQKEKENFVKGLLNDAKNTSNIFLVAEISGEVVGWIFSELGTWSLDIPVKTLWIEDLKILRKHKRKGIGRSLLTKTEKRAKETGIEYGYITVNTKNRAAHSLYKENGYEEFDMDFIKKL
jgi:ribosomal protein S18 acetylase RimI-like enzyme